MARFNTIVRTTLLICVCIAWSELRAECWRFVNNTTSTTRINIAWEPVVPENSPIWVELPVGDHKEFCGEWHNVFATVSVGRLGHRFETEGRIAVIFGDTPTRHPPGIYSIINRPPPPRPVRRDCRINPQNHCAELIVREVHVIETNEGPGDEVFFHYCRNPERASPICRSLPPRIDPARAGHSWRGSESLGVHGEYQCPIEFELRESDGVSEDDTIGRWSWNSQTGAITSGTWVPNYIHAPKPGQPSDWVWLVLEDSDAHYDVMIQVRPTVCE